MELTDEQIQIINHPDGSHGKVLSVAGSGKTTTMAYRIKHLIQERQVPKHQIQVLMFNRAARDQFVDTLAKEEIGIPKNEQPQVNTFHSYSYRLINKHGFRQWFGDTEELAHIALLRAVEKVRRDMYLDDDDLGVYEADQAIGLWKSALIPPSRAGYAGNYSDAYVAVYKAFEEERLGKNAITFDDFVPLAINELQVNPSLRHSTSAKLKYIIVDEYQDINLGQQRLIECLASHGADLMVVGDDDQTIYEWRGARSDYILGEFDATFDNKPHITYKLTNSFRFGYIIAQSSYNVITHNTNRIEKQLLSRKPTEECHVSLIADTDIADGYANRSLAEEILSLVMDKGVCPSDIRVLGRTFAQLNSFETELMQRKIPFQVIGHKPFLLAGESQALLDYVRVASKLRNIPNDATRRQFINIANKPSRYLARRSMERMIDEGRREGMTLHELLHETLQDTSRFSNQRQRDRLEELTDVLEAISRELDSEEEPLAGPLLEQIDQELEFQQHYKNYYGEGETSLIRMDTIRTFIAYAHLTEMKWKDFIEHTEKADTSFGMPEDQWIKMTTVHRTKGLEFDYVIVPNCEEGYMPVVGSDNDPTYDTTNPRRTPKAAEWIENERRLFYVAATRAKKGLYIGAPALVSKSENSATSGMSYTGQQAAVGQRESLKSSRFLEEMELDVTQEVATELVRALQGDQENKLMEVCRRYSGFHRIVGTIKGAYSLFFCRRDRTRLAQMSLSNAERPFEYKQEYAAPFIRAPQPSVAETNSCRNNDRPVWGHISLDYRRNSYSDGDALPF